MRFSGTLSENGKFNALEIQLEIYVTRVCIYDFKKNCANKLHVTTYQILCEKLNFLLNIFPIIRPIHSFHFWFLHESKIEKNRKWRVKDAIYSGESNSWSIIPQIKVFWEIYMSFIFLSNLSDFQIDCDVFKKLIL